ncbi:hypothetical protein FDB52_16335 [Clostridium botulinum]|nr:hypothetical protein [Clostridium botulinum]NFN50056.1 hypothetical protein [Clostridium botulinum]
MAKDMNNDNMHINLSSSGERIKYYDYYDDTCIFEILDDESNSDNIDMEYDEFGNNMNSMENCNSESDNLINNTDYSFENCKSDMQEYHTSNNSELNAFNYYNNSCTRIEGEIVVISTINCCGKNEYLEGVKINLYKLNGVSPVFIESCLTNKQGRAVFINLPEGCYRVIAIVNKNYFEKPKYVNWNEVNINRENTNAKILVMNNLKKNCRNNCRYR